MKNELWGRFYQEVIITGIWAKLPPIAKAVYPVLIRYAHITTKICTPTQKTIAEDSGIYWKSVPRGVKILKEHKLINTWITLWQGKRRVHYQILDPKTGIVPQDKDIYPPKKRQTSRVRDTKSGRFVSSALREGIHSASRCGTPIASPVGIKRDIRKRYNKDKQQGNNHKPNVVNDIFLLFEKANKKHMAKENIIKTLMINWGEDPYIATERVKIAIERATDSAPGYWVTLMRDRTSIFLNEPEIKEPEIEPWNQGRTFNDTLVTEKVRKIAFVRFDGQWQLAVQRIVDYYNPEYKDISRLTTEEKETMLTAIKEWKEIPPIP